MKNLLSFCVIILVLTACISTLQNSDETGEQLKKAVSPVSISKIDRRRSLYDIENGAVVSVYDEASSQFVIHTLYNCSLPENKAEFFPILCLDLIHVVGEQASNEYTWVISAILEESFNITQAEIVSPLLEQPLVVRSPSIPVKDLGENLGVLHQLYFATDEEFIVSMLLLNPVTIQLSDNDSLILRRDVTPMNKQLWFEFMKEVKANYDKKTESL